MLKRISTWQQARDSGKVTVDFGEGIRLSLGDSSVTDSNTSRIGTLEAAAPLASDNPTIVSAIKAGHGWTNGPTTNATFNLDDTTDKAVGDRSITITTDGTGGSGYVQKTGMSLNLTGRGLVFWVKAINIASIASVAVNIANADGFNPGWFTSLPIAAGGKSPLTDGEWFPVFLTLGGAGVNNGSPHRNPVTAVRVTLTGTNGLPAPTLKLGGLGTFVDKSQRYPAGVVSLTFDDTWASHATLAAPKMAEHGFPGTEYLIYSRVGTAGNLTASQLHMLREVYGWEIGGHASNDAAHIDWTTQTAAWVDAELDAILAAQDALGIRSGTFAYPIGPFNSAIARQVEEKFRSARSTYGWTNSATYPHRYRMSAYAITASVTLASAKTWVDRAVTNGGWPVFMFHNLVESAPTGNDWLVSDFNALMDHIAASGLPVATVGDVLR